MGEVERDFSNQTDRELWITCATNSNKAWQEGVPTGNPNIPLHILEAKQVQRRSKIDQCHGHGDGL
jgi:hypothetical protein